MKVEEKPSKHHVAGCIVIDGKKALPVHYSNGDGDMPAKIGDKFRKCFKLDEDDFRTLKGCKMTREEYIDLIRLRI
ncbi:MAG: hypothetical protein HQK89_12145 [Nitrospirae bacterium]|nr:hypothetical protein [Nitrospirota bacterium]